MKKLLSILDASGPYLVGFGIGFIIGSGAAFYRSWLIIKEAFK